MHGEWPVNTYIDPRTGLPFQHVHPAQPVPPGNFVYTYHNSPVTQVYQNFYPYAFSPYSPRIRFDTVAPPCAVATAPQPVANPYLQVRPLQQPSPSLSVSPSPTVASASSSRPSSTASRAARYEQPPAFPRQDSPPCEAQLRDQRNHTPPALGMSSDSAMYAEATRDLQYMTVDRLKNAIRSINNTLYTNLRLTGKKNDLYQSLLDLVVSEFNRPDKARFYTCKRLISEAKSSYVPSHRRRSSASSSSTSTSRTPAHDPAPPTPTSTAPYSSPTGGGGGGSRGTWAYTGGGSGLGANGYAGGHDYGAGSAGSSPVHGASTSGYGGAYGAGVSNRLPPPKFGSSSGGAGASASGSWQNQRVEEIPIKFRPSPFYRVDKALSSVVTLTKAAQGDRKVGTCSFTFTEAQRALLAKAKESPSNLQYQVRLYCTSDVNWNLHRPTANQFPAPIEFPGTCEIKLNGVTVPANTKGIKKQPGTTPPVNLSSGKGATVLTTAGSTNRVEVIYINTEKLYFLVCYLVEYTPVEAVVGKVKSGKTKSKEEVIKSIVDLNSDEDVEASSFRLELKDPLSFLRIAIPIRSAHCSHIACFDASIWFEMNEQTPQWQCPICNKTLKVDDIVVDGYFDDILKICPSSVESVTVEPDGTWRSDDNKHGTAKPRTAPASAAGSGRNTPVTAPDPGKPNSLNSLNGKGKARGSSAMANEALTLDSDTDDDDDERPAKRSRVSGTAPMTASGTGTPGSSASTNGLASRANEVLDLTLDSDDDAAPRPPAARGPVRPSLGMARTGSSEKKTVAEVQADIDQMNERMKREYGENWRDRFGY
ncbi:zinc finger, MIZ-type protein [Rhodotorula toruloides]|uniref:Zinc finger, MIZ-type protein n=1 Tax=Rhodotorula toruloides TaxID=5286 RepID=A0A511KP00_RHOTO|nr:zinc finger, MIZ-type protein [Rhodotorula toruloides]